MQEKINQIKKEYEEISNTLTSPAIFNDASKLVKLNKKQSIFNEPWPKYDSSLLKDEIITLIVQVNGKVRDELEVMVDVSIEEAKKLTLAREKVKRWVEGKEVKKVIFIPGKLINIVI